MSERELIGYRVKSGARYVFEVLGGFIFIGSEHLLLTQQDAMDIRKRARGWTIYPHGSYPRIVRVYRKAKPPAPVKSLGQVALEGFRSEYGAKSNWEGERDDAKLWWEAAAQAVVDEAKKRGQL